MYSFEGLSNPNNICDTTICKPKAMTCKEKTEKGQ